MGGLFGGGGTISMSEQRIAALRIQTSAYGLAIPLLYGQTRVAANMFWYGDFEAIAHTTTQKSGGKGGGGKMQNTTYTYKASVMLGLCEGEILSIGQVWKDKEQFAEKDLISATDQLGFEVFVGSDLQTEWGYLVSKHPAQALRYPRLAYVVAGGYDLGSNASLLNHNFEVQGKYSLGDLKDANPADVIYDLLDKAGYPTSQIGDFLPFTEYCLAANLLISPAITEQKAAHEIINELVESVNCAVVPSSGALRVVPYGDTPITGNGVTFMPDLTPVYHLTDDDFMDREDPVRVRRSRDADAFNHVQVEYVNRYNQYNVETTEAKDQANIEMYGLRSEDPVKYSHLCEPDIARHAAQLRLQRLLYVRNEYEFDLGWKYCLLEPMDIVTLTDEGLGLDQFPVRIKKIEEDADGKLTVTAEELVIGVGHAAAYDLQASNGYQGGNGEPDNVNAPMIFEPPLDLTGGSNQVWCAVSGGTNWGGCTVWASYDNATYTLIGTIYGAARYGTLVNAVNASATTLQVELNTPSQMYSGTAQDAATDQTLCMVGDEYFNYEVATLNSFGYALSTVHRGRFSDAASHAAGVGFVRLDRAIFKHDIAGNQVGQTIYLKFCSFNGLQKKEQALEDVSAYSYTLTGGRPSGVAGLQLQAPWIGTSFKVQWQPTQGATGYEVQVVANGVLKRTVQTTANEFVYSYEDAKTETITRNYTIRVASKSGGQTSSYAELNVSNSNPPTITSIITNSNSNSITMSWTASTAPDLRDYQAWISISNGFDPSATSATYTGTTNQFSFNGLTSGVTYYLRLAARDVWGSGTLNYSTQITKATT